MRGTIETETTEETDTETIETGTETTDVSNTETTTGHRRRSPKRRNGDFRTGQTLPQAPIGSNQASPNQKRKRIPRLKWASQVP